MGDQVRCRESAYDGDAKLDVEIAEADDVLAVSEIRYGQKVQEDPVPEEAFCQGGFDNLPEKWQDRRHRLCDFTYLCTPLLARSEDIYTFSNPF